MPRLIVEIKAKCDYQDEVRKILNSMKAEFKGVDHQIDTYFKVPKGRLKLREGNIENHLIFYNRDNKSGPKESRVKLYDFNPKSSFKEILFSFLEPLVVVDKKREIYFIDNIKFHLDNVQGLGTFVEIEAIDDNGAIGKEKLYEQCNKFMKLFNIAEGDLLSGSYSDMLLK